MPKYLVTLNRDVKTSIGHLVVLAGSGSSTIDAPTEIIQTAGARVFRTKKDAIAFQRAQRATHGQDVCGEVLAV